MLPDLRVVRSYWLANHESLRDVGTAAEFLTRAVRDREAAFVQG